MARNADVYDGHEVADRLTAGMTSHRGPDASVHVCGNPDIGVGKSFDRAIGSAKDAVEETVVKRFRRERGVDGGEGLRRAYVSGVERNAAKMDASGGATSEMRRAQASGDPSSVRFRSADLLSAVKSETVAASVRALRDAIAKRALERVTMANLAKFFRDGATVYATSNTATARPVISLGKRLMALTIVAGVSFAGVKLATPQYPHGLFTGGSFDYDMADDYVPTHVRHKGAPPVFDDAADARIPVREGLPKVSSNLDALTPVGPNTQGIASLHGGTGMEGVFARGPSERFLWVAKALASKGLMSAVTANAWVDEVYAKGAECLRMPEVKWNCDAKFNGVEMNFKSGSYVAKLDGQIVASQVDGVYKENPKRVGRLFQDMENTLQNELEHKSEKFISYD